MNLLQDERIISVSVGDKLTLTTHRVRYEYSNPSLLAIILKAIQGGEDPARRNRRYISLFLEQVTSIEYRYKSSWWLLLLALVCFLASLYIMIEGGHSDRDMVWVALPVGLLFLLAYFFSRKHMLAVNTAKGTAEIMLTLLHRDVATEIVDQIDQAKDDRMRYLHVVSAGSGPVRAVVPKPTGNVCGSCGALNAESDSYCMKCGGKLK